MATAETTKALLYGGAVEITVYPKSHRYKLDGRDLISVTGALSALNKPALLFWAVNLMADYLVHEIGNPLTREMIEKAKKQHTERKEAAATVGKLVHGWVNRYWTTGDKTLPDDEKVMNGVLAFLKWQDEHNVYIIDSERLVYSREHDYVGCTDAVARVDGRICLIDLKTSNNLHPEYRYQTAAYQRALEEEGVKFSGPRIVVRFDKESSEFEVVEYPEQDLGKDYAAFLGLLTVRKREQELNK